MALLQSRRLTAALGAPVDQLSAEHIEGLVSNQVPESFDLDFKESLYGNSGQEKRDLCGDVAAMANGSGGVIILGVVEDAHAIASATPGVDVGDSERNRMLQVLASGLAPLPALDILRVPDSADSSRGWWVLAVPPSSRAPHAVMVHDGLRFPVRNGTTIRYLSEPEVAAEYRRRDQRAGELSATLAELVSGSLASVDRENGPWILVALVPEHPGNLEISQARLRQMQQEYVSRDLFDTGRSGAHFEWVRTGRRRYTVGDGLYKTETYPAPRYGYAELHTDGSGSYAVELIDVAQRRRQISNLPDEASTDQMVYDDAIALAILTGLRRLASHARDTTGATGAATLRAHLVPSPGRSLLIGHSRGHGFIESRSGNAVADSAIAESAAALDDLADPGPALVAVAARMLDELGNSFGIAEMGQLSSDGEIRRPYWRDPNEIISWAEDHGITVSLSTIS